MKKLLENKWFFYPFQIVLVIAITFPIFYATVFSVFNSDDFSSANSIIKIGSINHIIAAVKFTIDTYKNWQGTYFSNFINGLTPCIYQCNICNRMFLIISNLFFFICLYLATREILIVKNETKKSFIGWFYIATVISFLSIRFYPEVFYWYNGNAVYGVPMSFGLMGIFLLLISDNNKSKFCCTVAAACLFFMAGGSLQIVGTCLYLVLLLLLDNLYISKKLSLYYVVPFVIGLIGAVINVLAPGNYLRHNAVYGSDLDVISTLRISVLFVIREYSNLICNKYVILMLCFVFIMGIKTKKVNQSIWMVIVKALLLLVMPIINVFPVFLGYSYEGFYDMPSRFYFVLDLNIIIVLLWIVTIFAKQTSLNSNREIVLMSSMVIILLIPVYTTISTENCWYTTVCDLRENKIQNYSTNIENMYFEMADSKERNVRVNIPQNPTSSFLNVEISDVTSDWKNSAMAEFFNKDSIAAVRE